MSERSAGPARGAAYAALLATERGATPSDALHRCLTGITDPRERGLATELCYGVVRWQRALDAELARFVRRPQASLDASVRVALRLGLYQLRYLRSVPSFAAVDTSVTLVRGPGQRPGATGFVNAVLRAAACAPSQQPQDGRPEDADALGEQTSHPSWLVRRYLQRLGPAETRALLAANNRPPRVVLRANRIRQNGSDLLRALRAEGVEAEPGRWLPEAVVLGRVSDPGMLAAFRQGRATVQGEASMLAVVVLDPQPGDICLDIAAGLGGKTTQIAERMGDQGRVIANDIHPGPLALARQACKRLGLRSVEFHEGDARDVPDRWAGQCDRVLADVPCSGLGVLAGRPDLRWRKLPEDIPALAQLQSELLRAAARCVRPGGTLVYSTCTTEPEENEHVVASFLERHPNFVAFDLREVLPEALWGEPSVERGQLNLWPHRHGTEGFFIAGLRHLEPPRE